MLPLGGGGGGSPPAAEAEDAAAEGGDFTLKSWLEAAEAAEGPRGEAERS